MNGDVLIEKMLDELKAGADIEEVVDKYCTCKTPRLRQQLIDGIREIVGHNTKEKDCL